MVGGELSEELRVNFSNFKQLFQENLAVEANNTRVLGMLYEERLIPLMKKLTANPAMSKQLAPLVGYIQKAIPLYGDFLSASERFVRLFQEAANNNFHFVESEEEVDAIIFSFLDTLGNLDLMTRNIKAEMDVMPRENLSEEENRLL